MIAVQVTTYFSYYYTSYPIIISESRELAVSVLSLHNKTFKIKSKQRTALQHTKMQYRTTSSTVKTTVTEANITH